MEKARKIIRLCYTGEVDTEGLPHGQGELRYVVEPRPDDSFPGQGELRYVGEFVHGLRQGDGDLHSLGSMYNPVSEYEWYAEGDYDSCGRFLHPAHAPGTWQRTVKCWYPTFEGTWQDDMPLKSRWGDGSIDDISKAHWKDIRRTAREALGELKVES